MSDHTNTAVGEVQEIHMHRDDFGSKMGMWLFLFTEILLFGGLFILYASYRFIYPDAFVVAAAELDLFMGGINTVILLTSSLTVVLGIVALQKGHKKLSLSMLWITIAFGLLPRRMAPKGSSSRSSTRKSDREFKTSTPRSA